MQRLSARPHHVGSPTTRTTPSGCSRSSRSGAGTPRSKRFDVLFPTPKERRARAGRADALHGEARRAGRRGRSDVGPEERAAADLQRVLDRRRRHGAARLRQLRPARGLRGARALRHLGAKAPSSSRATADRGAASSRRSRPSTARSAASSIPIRRDDGYCDGRRVSERADARRPTACSAAA